MSLNQGRNSSSYDLTGAWYDIIVPSKVSENPIVDIAVVMTENRTVG